MPFELYCPTTVKPVTNGTFEIQNLKFQQKQNESHESYFGEATPEEIIDEINISELTSQ